MASIQLMPHQEKAIRELKSGSILCADVGTGKSMTALAYYFLYICKGVLWSNVIVGPILEPRALYIITTARKRDTGEWESELKRFGFEKGGENEIDYTIDSWNNLHKYTKVNGAFFIFDEQRVVGHGKWVKSFYRVSRRNKWIILSATPGDTWLDYIPVFVANGFYRNRSDFLFQHAVYNQYITKFPKIDRFTGVGLLEKHRREITVKMTYIKHTKRNFHDIIVDYDKDLYKKVWKDRWDPWKNEPIKDISGCCFLLRKTVNSTVERANKMLWTALNSITHKAIVFYNYDYELTIIKDEVEQAIESAKEANPEQFNAIYGDFELAEWNGHKHQPIPETRSWIYLVQYAAGSEGWNCVETDTVIFYSMSYSYKMMEQAAGRIDRMNTTFENLHYYILKTESPIDKAVERAIKNKKDFNEQKYWMETSLED